MKNLLFGFCLLACSTLLCSFTVETTPAESAPETFIIDGDGNIFHFADGYDCLIDLGSGNSYGDC